MATYVLVHGAWHGGWCWRDVAGSLRAAGHQVLTPTLTGLGERASELRPDVGLRTHVDDVVELLRGGDLRDVVLVGHSYSGLVVGGAAAPHPPPRARRGGGGARGGAAAAAGARPAAAHGPVEQGAVGAGTGMIAFGWKGGIGSASRVVPGHGALGVLVLANFGTRGQLRVDGVAVGRALPPDPHERRPAGSCIALVATDAPLAAPQLERLARRAGLGLARTGSVAHHGSGEIFLALSSGEGATAGRDLDALFAATVEATEEAVLNALWSAETTAGRDGRVVEALPHDETVAALRAARRN